MTLDVTAWSWPHCAKLHLVSCLGQRSKADKKHHPHTALDLMLESVQSFLLLPKNLKVGFLSKDHPKEGAFFVNGSAFTPKLNASTFSDPPPPCPPQES